MTTAADSPPAASLSHRQVLLIPGALLLGMFLAALDQTIVSVALPTIVGELGGLNNISYVVTAYLLTSTGASCSSRRQSGSSSVLCGVSQNFIELVLLRAVQGFGAA